MIDSIINHALFFNKLLYWRLSNNIVDIVQQWAPLLILFLTIYDFSLPVIVNLPEFQLLPDLIFVLFCWDISPYHYFDSVQIMSISIYTDYTSALSK